MLFDVKKETPVILAKKNKTKKRSGLVLIVRRTVKLAVKHAHTLIKKQKQNKLVNSSLPVGQKRFSKNSRKDGFV